MRYTTLIDITETKEVYKSTTARLVYLHMALRAGYHDSDRDMLQISIRQLAADVGVTVSATRHALKMLQRYQLIRRDGPIWTVRKWILQEDISKRPTSKRQQQQIDAAIERKKAEEARQLQQQIEEEQRNRQWQTGKTSFMVWYEAQQRKAEAGDQDAARAVERHRATYEAHSEQIKNNENKTRQ